jgi:ABC-2 type transport system permease protein
MRNTLLIAKREYLEQIHGRAFLVSTVMLPLLIVALLAWSSTTQHKAVSGNHIAIVADNAELAEQVRREMLYDKAAKYTVDVVAPATPQDRTELQKQLRAKAIDGVLALESSPTGEIAATYTSLSAGGYAGIGELQNQLNRGLVHERLTATNMKPAELDDILKWVSIETLQLDENGRTAKSQGRAPFFKAFMVIMLLSMPIILYGLDMARAIIEEKTSRIFEVMLAIVKPDDLLAGKLVGVGAVGLTQIAIWLVAASLFMGSTLAASALTGNFAIHFSWMEGLFFPVYFVLGFALFSAIFSGLAATCETAQDLQKFMPVAIIPLYLSMGLLFVLLKDPNSAWSVAATICPLTSPYVMIPRMGMETVPMWQLAVSIGLLIVSVWATLWFSSRLYRIGILMYGKRATLPELLRWLRYS